MHGALSLSSLSSMSGTGIAVVAVLVLLSIWSLAVSVERTIAFARARRQSLAFARWLNESRRQDWLESALESAARYPHSHLARVVSAGLQTFQRKKARGTATKAEILEAADRALDRSAHRATAELRRGVGSLATIASTAPFIGLFGTVIGIIHAFQDIATHGNGGFEIVSKGIAEALVTTALGLVVAIPAAWMFNHLTQKVERLTLEMESSSSELLEFFVELEEGDGAAAG